MCCFSASSSANLESHSLQKNAPFSVPEKWICIDFVLSTSTLRVYRDSALTRQTHHNWSPSIPSAVLSSLQLGGTWTFWGRLPSAVRMESRRMSSSNGWNSAEVGFHRSSVSPRVRCRQNTHVFRIVKQKKKTTIIMWKRLQVNVKRAEDLL